MGQIGEQEFRDAIVATKKDTKLVAAAKNDRTYLVENLYKEFSALSVDRQREIISTIAADYFVAAQWKIAFPLNNFAPAILPDAVRAAGKVLFFSRDEDSLRESVRSIKLYQESPFLKQIASVLAEASEVARAEVFKVAAILNHPGIFGMIRQLQGLPTAEHIVRTIGYVSMLTRDLESTTLVANFLVARRHSKYLPELAALIGESIFFARDRKSVREILGGFTTGSIDVVLQKQASNKQTLAAIRDVAWKTKDAASIRSYLSSLTAE